jgi:hypothetical protein
MRCRTMSWNYTVTFSEQNGVPATIERLGRRSIHTNGSVWASETGEWFNTTIAIPGRGRNTYGSWVRTTPDDIDLRGGIVILGYSGHDANGFAFDGSVSARLEYPVTTK